MAWEYRSPDSELSLDDGERSFSDSGDVAWQGIADLDYGLNARWDLQADVRYGYLDDVDPD